MKLYCSYFCTRVVYQHSFFTIRMQILFLEDVVHLFRQAFLYSAMARVLALICSQPEDPALPFVISPARTLTTSCMHMSLMAPAIVNFFKAFQPCVSPGVCQQRLVCMCRYPWLCIIESSVSLVFVHVCW